MNNDARTFPPFAVAPFMSAEQSMLGSTQPSPGLYKAAVKLLPFNTGANLTVSLGDSI